MRISSNRKALCISLLPLVTQIAAATTPGDTIRKLEERVTILEHKERVTKKNKVIDPVLALPQVNLREKYDRAPSYNQDLAMLKMRKNFNRELKKRQIEPLPYPRIELGGSIITLGTYRIPPRVPPRDGNPQNDLNLSGANLNVTSEITDYLMGALRISYNPNGSERFDETSITTRVANSSIFLNTAFLTLGDLQQFPFYISAGQMFLPFGQYNSSLVTAPLSARIGRFRQRPVLLGFQQPGTDQGFNASIFAFSGDAFVEQRSSKINNRGANIGYNFSRDFIRLSAGASYVRNIADSGGMQNTGASAVVTDAGEFADNEFLEFDEGPLLAFRGFGAFQRLEHVVPAYDTRARISLPKLHLSFYGEMVKPTRAFAIDNLSFNEDGAKPSAWNAEGSFDFTLFDKECSITMGYGKSSQALGLNLPLSTRGIAFRIRPQKYISLAIGYTYDEAYSILDDASGQNLPVTGLDFLGTTSKLTTAQINARF